MVPVASGTSRRSQFLETEGTLNIDLVDRKEMKLVWEGVAVGSVGTSNQSDIQQRIEKVVEQIFANTRSAPASKAGRSVAVTQRLRKLALYCAARGHGRSA